MGWHGRKRSDFAAITEGWPYYARGVARTVNRQRQVETGVFEMDDDFHARKAGDAYVLQGGLRVFEIPGLFMRARPLIRARVK